MKLFSKFKPKTSLMAVVVSIVLLLTTPTDAFFRHLCHGQVGVGRVDPLMSPGKTSQHVHNIQGAANFGFDPTIDELVASNCTSCSIMQDKSAYWSPQMYFEHDNGTFQIVPVEGGLTAYYFTERPDVGQAIEPFPKDFRMITGNSLKRDFVGKQPVPDMSLWGPDDRTQVSLMEKSIGFNCLNYNAGAEGALEYHGLRPKDYLDAHCAQGIRAEIQFPSCWNGDLDSSNHASHVAYSSRLRNGDCPPGYPRRLPVLFLETIYQTNLFASIQGRFVFANGDPTGYGYHADFIAGWDDGVLQAAINEPLCTEQPGGPAISGNQWDCPVFSLRSEEELSNCKMQMPEAIQGEALNFVDALPGKVVVQDGPGSATMPGMLAMAASSTAAASPSSAARPAPAATSVAYPNTTAAAAPPATTAVPTSISTTTNEVVTKTSVTVIGGTVYHWVILEEIVTTTVLVDAPKPTGGVKRHVHSHRHGYHG